MNAPRPSIDDLLTPEQFAQFLGVSVEWVRQRIETLPGVIRESREVVRVWPRAYMEARTLKGARR